MEPLPIETPKRSPLKFIGRLLLWLVAGAVFLLGSLLALLFVYEDEVKAAIVKELNKHLKAEVKIAPENIDLTIIKTFPDCSIQFKDLLMLEALPVKNRDTLIFAGQLNLHFNISDLWKKQYNIDKIKLKDAVAKFRVLKDGRTNYDFWKESAAKTTTSDSTSFHLKLVSVENCRVLYSNKQQLFKTALDIDRITFRGNFGQSQFDLGAEAKLLVHQVTHEKNTYLKNKRLDFAVELAVAGSRYTFKKTRIDLSHMALALDGGFTYKDSLQNLSVAFNAPGLDIASVLSLLPETFKKNINDYESSGSFYAQGKIIYAGKNSYNLSSSFGIKKGSVTYKPQSTTASNVNIDGRLELSPSSSLLDLGNIYLRLGNDELKGSCLIRNFSDPYIRFSSQLNVHLENLQAFFPIDTLTDLKGEVKMVASAEGQLKDLKDQTFSTKVKLDLDAQVTGLVAQFKGDEHAFSVENCAITAREREIEVKDLILKRGSSDIKLNGRIPGVFNYLLDRTAPLIISGSLRSENLRLDDFLPKNSGGSSSTANNKALIPGNVQFKLNTAITKFSFGKFEATAVTGEIDIKDQKAIISDVKLETMQGEAEINAFADNSKPNRLEVVLQSNLKGINIQQLFAQLNNFGQSTMEDKNIKGYATASIDFSGTWNNKLEANLNSIRTNCNLLVERGELIDFKPLLSLSKFVDVDDLKHVRFSTLQSRIDIDNSIITFQKTSIKNSALDLDFGGKQGFDGRIDYRIQLYISELLAQKRRHRNTDEFGPVEGNDKRYCTFIRMTGTLDKPDFSYDRKGMKEKIKNDLKEEKQNIRQILKEELGLFKKDTTSKKRRQETNFELEKSNSAPPKKTLELKKKEEEDF